MTADNPIDPDHNGAFYIRVVLMTVLTEPPRQEHARMLGDRLEFFLPEGSYVTEIHTFPPEHRIDFTVFIQASMVLDAVQEIMSSIEHLAINVRREHGLDPMGPAPLILEVHLTRAQSSTDS